MTREMDDGKHLKEKDADWKRDFEEYKEGVNWNRHGDDEDERQTEADLEQYTKRLEQLKEEIKRLKQIKKQQKKICKLEEKKIDVIRDIEREKRQEMKQKKRFKHKKH